MTQQVYVSGVIKDAHINRLALLFHRFDSEESSRNLLRNVGNLSLRVKYTEVLAWTITNSITNKPYCADSEYLIQAKLSIASFVSVTKMSPLARYSKKYKNQSPPLLLGSYGTDCLHCTLMILLDFTYRLGIFYLEPRVSESLFSSDDRCEIRIVIL